VYCKTPKRKAILVTYLVLGKMWYIFKLKMTNLREQNTRPLLRIHITGQNGSGGSTLAKNLESHLAAILGPEKITRFSGGRLRRAAAWLWHEWRSDPNRIAEIVESHDYTADLMDTTATPLLNITQTLWLKFESEFDEMFRQYQLEGLLNSLTPYMDRPQDDAVLGDFNDTQSKYSPESILWDKATETYLLHLTQTAQTSYVLESKLAVIFQDIQELQALVRTNSGWALPALRLMLTVDPEVAAARISERELEPTTVERVLARRADDSKRYGNAYHMMNTGKPFTEQDLRDASIVIDTSDKDKDQVLLEALSHLARFLSQEGLPEVQEHRDLQAGVEKLIPTP
jgi:cytidylate kinase